MRFAYCGNFRPEYSTENDIRDSLGRMGHSVVCVQEEDGGAWRRLINELADYDGVLWTSTRDLAAQIPAHLQREMLYQARLRGVPTIGIHLDRWWGLERWRSVLEAPFFHCEWLFTADGAHQKHWQAAGVNHHWSPPAIADRWAQPGEPDPMFTSPIAFVGSWQGGYHHEWQHRYDLVEFLRKTYRDKVKFWPRKGEPAVRGKRLADLYASTKVVVGDSCLVPTVEGEPMHHYCSDRVFETIGRGGFFLHPAVEGITTNSADEPNLLHDLEHLATWPLGDWANLRLKIDHYLADDEARAAVAKQGQEHVAENHTYSKRLEDIFDDIVGLT